MIESFVEDAAFQAARHMVVIGASIEEGEEIAENSLAIFGVQNASISIAPKFNGVVQSQINDATETVTVNVAVPMRDNLTVSHFMKDFVIERTAVMKTERYRNLSINN